jgi:hypothetical protein
MDVDDNKIPLGGRLHGLAGTVSDAEARGDGGVRGPWPSHGKGSAARLNHDAGDANGAQGPSSP